MLSARASVPPGQDCLWGAFEDDFWDEEVGACFPLDGLDGKLTIVGLAFWFQR